jgi:hypothetical protein
MKTMHDSLEYCLALLATCMRCKARFRFTCARNGAARGCIVLLPFWVEKRLIENKWLEDGLSSGEATFNLVSCEFFSYWLLGLRIGLAWAWKTLALDLLEGNFFSNLKIPNIWCRNPTGFKPGTRCGFSWIFGLFGAETRPERTSNHFSLLFWEAVGFSGQAWIFRRRIWGTLKRIPRILDFGSHED